jgi:DNA polymerase-3 subunit delta
MNMKTTSKQGILSFNDFERHLKNGKDSGAVVFFYGEESYLLERAIKLFVNSHLDDSTREYGVIRLDGDSCNWGDIENALKTSPMFTIQKVILLHHPGHLSMAVKSALTEYFRKPTVDTWLGLIEPEVDWRKKPYKEWSELVVRVQCESLTDADLTRWITDIVKEEGFHISEESLRILESISDGDMQIIYGILEKAFLLMESGETITEEILSSATGDACRYTWDSLLEAIANRDFSKLWSAVDYLQKQVPSATYFTQILSRSFQGALLAQQAKWDIPFDINVYKSIGYFGKSRILIQNIAKNYSRKEIEEGLAMIRTTDRELKTSAKLPGPAIYSLLAKIVFAIR